MSAQAYPTTTGQTEVPNTIGAPILSFRVASVAPYIDLSTYLALTASTNYVYNDCNLTVTQFSGTSGNGLSSVTGKTALTFDKMVGAVTVPIQYGNGNQEARTLFTTPTATLNPLIFPSVITPSQAGNLALGFGNITLGYGGAFTDGTNYYLYGGAASAYLSYVNSTITTTTSLLAASGTKALIHGCYGSGRTNPYVYVGIGGVIFSGATGTVAPTSRTSGTTNNLYSIAYSSSLGMYVAVGQSGTILTSTDGATWTAQTSGVATDLNGITWTGSYFCAVGASGVILTSTNGTSWTSRTSGAGSGVTWQHTASTLGNTRTVALTTTGLLYGCTDGTGASWSQITAFNVVSTGYNTPIFSQTSFSVQGYNGITPINSKMTLYAGLYDASGAANNRLGVEYGSAGAFIYATTQQGGGYYGNNFGACAGIGSTSSVVMLTNGSTGTNGYAVQYVFPMVSTTAPIEIFNPRTTLTL